MLWGIIKGVYVLFLIIIINFGKRLEVMIVWNGYWFCNLFVGDIIFFFFGFNMVVVVLDIGDRVLVRIYDKFYDDGVIIDGVFFLFFGFLLYEIDWMIKIYRIC